MTVESAPSTVIPSNAQVAAAAIDIPKDVTGASATPAQARDPLTGRYVNMHVGAEPHPEDVAIEGDRGDDVVPAQPRVEATPPPETPATETPSDAVAKGEDAQGEETPPEKPTKPDRNMIPRDRFDEVNERRKALEKENAELKARTEAKAQAAEGAYDFVAKERQHMELVLDGKFDEAIQLRSEIDDAKREQWLEQAAERAEQRIETKSTKQTVETYVAEVTEQYDVFNEESANFREDLAEEVDALMAGYMSKGLDPLKALKKAVGNVVKLNGLDPVEQQVTTEKSSTPPRIDVQKKIDQAKGQPPPTAAAGRPADAAGTLTLPQPDQMTEEELDALPRSTYARMRGDVL